MASRKSGRSRDALCAQLALNDPDLAELIRRWADLPEAVRASIMGIIERGE